MIIRYPLPDSPQRLSARDPFMVQLQLAPRGLYTALSQVDGMERIKLGN